MNLLWDGIVQLHTLWAHAASQELDGSLAEHINAHTTLPETVPHAFRVCTGSGRGSGFHSYLVISSSAR